MTSKYHSFFRIVFIVLFLTACAGKVVPENSPILVVDATVKTKAPATASQSGDQATSKPPSDIDPLTGLKVSNPGILDRRPVMVKVSNYPANGRPHAGLAFADIVFDYYIGYGQNRFLAVFYGQDANSIGPVRSGRLVDIQLTKLYQGILGFGSADGDTLDVIYKNLGRRSIINTEAPCPAFCGTDTHSVIGVFANSAEISRWYSQQAGDNHRFDLGGMNFGNLLEQPSKPASLVTIIYNYDNRTEWKYDSASNQYLRWMNEEMVPQSIHMISSTERTTGKQLGFSNLIILFAQYTEFAPSKHDVEIFGNTQGQRAVFFRDGKEIEGTWKIVNRSKPIQFFGPDGKPLPLAAGNSWIVLAGMASLFRETQPGQWKMDFALP
jgi:hypothetical protein